MSVRIRFKRVGKPKQPFYRLVAIDRRSARDAKELEVLGHYNPRAKDNVLNFKPERVQYWLKRPGAWPNGSPESKYLLPFVKIEIPTKLAKAVLRLLHDKGINHASIMPSHDHVVPALEFMRKNKFPIG